MIVPTSSSLLSAAGEGSLSAAGQAGGGSGQFMLFGIMLLAIIAMFWFSSRTRRKQQQQVKERQATMEPGTEVMTSYGLYGRLVSKDEEAVKAVIEIAPGTNVTVHLQTLTNVVDPQKDAGAASAKPGASAAGATAAPAATGAAEAAAPGTAASTDEIPSGDPTDPRDPGSDAQR